MKIKMRFERTDISSFSSDFQTVVAELTGEPIVVETLKDVIVDYMKKQGNWGRY